MSHGRFTLCLHLKAMNINYIKICKCVNGKMKTFLILYLYFLKSQKLFLSVYMFTLSLFNKKNIYKYIVNSVLPY